MKARALATPITLAVLAAGAVAYAYLVDQRVVSDADRAARGRDVFPSLRVDEVSRVQISHGDEALVLARDLHAAGGAPSAWTMTSPRHEAADPSAVDVLLRELELAVRVRDVAETGPLGLDSPRARGRLEVGALEYRFALGADAPTPEGAAYMRVDGEGTFVVGRALKVQLLRGAEAYRDRVLVPLAAHEMGRVEVHTATGHDFALTRSGAAPDSFRLESSGLRASRATVDHLLSVLADARAETFVDDADAAATPDAGWARLLVSPRDAGRPPVELRIGPSCPGQPSDAVVVRSSPTPTAACTARILLEAADQTDAGLADGSPLFARADEVEQVRIEGLGGGPRVELARKGTGWRERAPEDRDLDTDESDSATALVRALADARAEAAPRREAAGQRWAPRARITVHRTGAGDEAAEVIELGAPNGQGGAIARRLDDGALLLLSRAAARRFEPHPVALRGRGPWRSPFDAGDVAAMIDGCAPAAERVERRESAWIMREPAGFTADGAAVADRARALAELHVHAWIAEADDGGFGFEGPGACTVTFGLGRAAAGAAEAPRRVALVFGGEGDGGVYAHTLEDPAVFVVDKSLRDLVGHPAVDGSRLRIDTDAIDAVVLSRGSARIALDRRADRWVRRARPAGADAGAGSGAASGAGPVAGADAGVGSGASVDGSDDGGDDRLAAALDGVHAQAAVHVGPPTRDEGMDRPTLEIAIRGAARDGDAAAERRIVIGAPTSVDGQDAYFARVSGVDATFAVPRRAVGAILDAW